MLYSSAFEKPKILWYSNRIGNLSISFVFAFFDYIGYLAKEYLISLKQTDNKLDGNEEPWKIF